MAEKVIMPKQGLQMTEGTITKWIIREGGDCVSGQPLFEMETDKLVITIDAHASGQAAQDYRPGGRDHPHHRNDRHYRRGRGRYFRAGGSGNSRRAARINGRHAARRGNEGICDGSQGRSPALGYSRKATPRAAWRAGEKGIDIDQVTGSGPDHLIIERGRAGTSTPQKPPRWPARLPGKPAYRLQTRRGTGAHGKVTRADVEALDAAHRAGNAGSRRNPGPVRRQA